MFYFGLVCSNVLTTICWYRSVGGTFFQSAIHTIYLISAGIRVSLYNAVTEEQTDKLVAYIKEFVEKEAVVAAQLEDEEK